MSGPRRVNGQLVGGPILLTYILTGVDATGLSGADTGLGIKGPAGYKGRLQALYAISTVGVNNPLSLGIADVNDAVLMPLSIVGTAGGFTQAGQCDLCSQADVEACQELSGEDTGNNDNYKVIGDATGAGSGTINIVAVVSWVPGDAPTIPDEGGG